MKINVFLMEDFVVDYITTDLNKKGGFIVDLANEVSNPKVFVVNVGLSGKSIEVFGFLEAESAENCFKNIAGSKFSNWEEYSQDDISSILDDGFERNGYGSLNISWL